MKKSRSTTLAAVALVAALLVVAWFAFPGAVMHVVLGVERGLAGLRENTVRVGDHDLVFLDEADGDPAVVLVHGFGADKESWTRFARHLPDGVRVVALDLPGFGASTRLETASYDIAAQVERLDGFVRALGLLRFHLAGSSMGGHLSTAYAALHPDRVLTLGLFAPAGVKAPVKSELEAAIDRGENPLVSSSPDEYGRFLDLVFVEKPFFPGPILRHLVARAAANRAFDEKVWRDLGARPLPLEPLLGRVRAPTMVLWGDGDRVLNPSGAAVFTAGIPHAYLVVMERCGHAPMVERPAEAAEHYRAFIETAVLAP